MRLRLRTFLIVVAVGGALLGVVDQWRQGRLVFQDQFGRASLDLWQVARESRAKVMELRGQLPYPAPFYLRLAAGRPIEDLIEHERRRLREAQFWAWWYGLLAGGWRDDRPASLSFLVRAAGPGRPA